MLKHRDEYIKFLCYRNCNSQLRNCKSHEPQFKSKHCLDPVNNKQAVEPEKEMIDFAVKFIMSPDSKKLH